MINTTQDGTTEISIIPTIFEKIMRNGGFEDPRGILKDWKSDQLLSFEKDRLTRSRIINTNSPINVYVILVKQKLDRK